jgi:hypothetical protein
VSGLSGRKEICRCLELRLAKDGASIRNQRVSYLHYTNKSQADSQTILLDEQDTSLVKRNSILADRDEGEKQPYADGPESVELRPVLDSNASESRSRASLRR